MKLTFKQCKKEDLKELMSIARSTYYDAFIAENSAENMKLYLDFAFDKEKLSTELENEETEFYFAYLMDELVGYFKINWEKTQDNINDKEAVEVERIYVMREFQRKKLGQQMLEKTIELSKSKGAQYIWLGVWEKNIKAIRFYERNGFEKFGEHDFMLGNEKQNDILMKRFI